MSSTLQWRPAHTENTSLSYELKVLLREVFGEPINTTLSAKHLPILGALAAGRGGAVLADIQKLVVAIDNCGEVILEELYL